MDMKKILALMTWIPIVDHHALIKVDHLLVVVEVREVAREIEEEIMVADQALIPTDVVVIIRALDLMKVEVNFLEAVVDTAVMMIMKIQDLTEVVVVKVVEEVPGMEEAAGMRKWIKVITVVLHQEEVVMMTIMNHLEVLIIEMRIVIMVHQLVTPAVTGAAANHKNAAVNHAETDKLFGCNQKIPLNIKRDFF